MTADVLTQRLAAQLPSGQPAADPVAVVERLLAVQAQDPRGFRLALRARSSGVSVPDSNGRSRRTARCSSPR